jgi:hypothetical protein
VAVEMGGPFYISLLVLPAQCLSHSYVSPTIRNMLSRAGTKTLYDEVHSVFENEYIARPIIYSLINIIGGETTLTVS